MRALPWLSLSWIVVDVCASGNRQIVKIHLLELAKNGLQAAGPVPVAGIHIGTMLDEQQRQLPMADLHGRPLLRYAIVIHDPKCTDSGLRQTKEGFCKGPFAKVKLTCLYSKKKFIDHCRPVACFHCFHCFHGLARFFGAGASSSIFGLGSASASKVKYTSTRRPHHWGWISSCRPKRLCLTKWLMIFWRWRFSIC